MGYGNGYGNGGRSPYAQQSSPQDDNGAAMGRDSYGGQNVEMAPLTQNGSLPGERSDPNYILNACRDIDAHIAATNQFINDLENLRYRVGNELDQGVIANELAIMASNSSTAFKSIIDEISRLKRMPESGSARNQPQIGRVQRKLKGNMEAYKANEMAFQHAVRDQMRREYRIVHPEATEDEVTAAVPNAEPQQMFQQALMTSNRQGQANTTLNAVRQRNEAIKKIEQDIIQIAELFSEMESLVVQQEAAVVNIEMKGEEVVENMDKGVQQMDTAIVSARSRNRKKWYCLGICVILIAIIAIVLAVHFINQSKNNNNGNNENKISIKRFIPSVGSAPAVSGRDSATSDRYVAPGIGFIESKIVIPGKKWSGDKAVSGAHFTPAARKWTKFVA